MEETSQALQPFIPATSQGQVDVQEQNQPILMGPIDRTVSERPTLQPPQVKESAWPMVLGITSLLATGNAGPLLHIMEQKRQTQFYQQAFPYQADILQKTKAGDFEGAIKTASQGFANFGRAPEVAKFFQEAVNRLNIEQTNFRDLKWQSDLAKENLPDNHPNKTVWNGIDKLLKAGTFASLQTAQRLMSDMKPEIQQYEGVQRITSPYTMQMVEKVQTPTFQPSEVSDMSLNMLSNDAEMLQAFKVPLGRNDITQIMRSSDPNTAPAQNFLRQKLGQVRDYEFKFNVAKNIPLEPGIAEGLLKQGISQEDVGIRNATPAQWGKSVDMLYQRQYATAAATLTARADVNSIQTGMGYTVDVNTGQLDTQTPFSTAIRTPGKAILPDKESYGAFKALFEARNRLSLVLPAINSLPDTPDFADRVASFVVRELNQRVPLDPKLSGEQALQTMAKDAVERMANALGIKAERFDYLTRPVTGTIAAKQNAVEVYNRLADFIETQYNLLAQQNNRKSLEKFLPQIAPPSGTVKPGTTLTPDFSRAK